MELFPVPGCRNRKTAAYLTDDTPDGTSAQLPWRSSWAQSLHHCIYINNDELMSRGRLWRQSLMCASCSYFQIGFPALFFVLRALHDKWHYEHSSTIRNSSVISPIMWPVLLDERWQQNLSINGLTFRRRQLKDYIGSWGKRCPLVRPQVAPRCHIWLRFQTLPHYPA